MPTNSRCFAPQWQAAVARAFCGWLLCGALLDVASAIAADSPVALRPRRTPGTIRRGFDSTSEPAAYRSRGLSEDAPAPAYGLGRGIPFGVTNRDEYYNELHQSVTPLVGGGFATVWNDGEPPATAVRLQIVRSDGTRVFGAAGLLVASAQRNHHIAVLAPHPVSGVFVAFQRWSPGSAAELIVQWVGADGKPHWSGEGISVFGPPAANRYYADPSLVAAPDGTLIVCAGRSIFDGKDTIRCQRLGARGRTLWGPEGADAGGATGWHVLPKAVSDRHGGALVFWENNGDVLQADRQDAKLIEGQHFAADGSRLWGDAGRIVRTTNLLQGDSYIFNEYDAAADGVGGAVLAFNDWNHGQPPTLDVLAQRVNSDGDLLWGDGIPVAQGLLAQQLDTLTAVEGGAVILVDEFRSATRSTIRIYRLAASGAPLWGRQGRAFSDPAAQALDFGGFGSWDGGKLRFLWTHQRAPGTWDFSLYLTRYTLAGLRLTAPAGIPLSTLPFAQFSRGFAWDPRHGTGLAVFEVFHPEAANAYDTWGTWFRDGN